MDITRKFSVGVNIDDAWRYAGVPEPRSIIIPHLLSLSLPEGRALDELEDAEIVAHGDTEPNSRAARASLALADNLQSTGVDYVRCWFAWSFFEPTPVPTSSIEGLLEVGYPSYPMDGFVQTLSSRGIQVVPVLCCGYQRMLPKGLSPDSDPTAYIRRAAVHARLLARHYRGKVKLWQVENEPNWWEMHEAGGWRSGVSWTSVRFKTELLEALAIAVREEDPAALVMVNLEGDRGLGNLSEYSSADVLGLDYYPNYRASDPVDPQFFSLASEAAVQSGKPVFVAETGYPSGPSVLGYTPAKQAQYLRVALQRGHAADSVTAVGIWRYLDTAWKSFPAQENHFGLIDEKGGPKPAWETLRETIGELKG